MHACSLPFLILNETGNDDDDKSHCAMSVVYIGLSEMRNERHLMS